MSIIYLHKPLITFRDSLDKDTSDPVSYTHLDVYKRQGINNSYLLMFIDFRQELQELTQRFEVQLKYCTYLAY